MFFHHCAGIYLFRHQRVCSQNWQVVNNAISSEAKDGARAQYLPNNAKDAKLVRRRLAKRQSLTVAKHAAAAIEQDALAAGTQ
jgi:hypothetical protein